MRSTQRNTPRFITAYGFSLIELSVVVAILSVVAVFGLEAASNFLNRSSGALTKERLAVVDDAIARFFRIYGRLPCPATLTTAPTSTSYGTEICTTAVFGTTGTNNGTQYGGGLMRGGVPFRVLNLPMSYSYDGFGNRLEYVVTKNLTVTGGSSTVASRFASTGGTTTTDGLGGIEVRSGVLEQPCATSKCQLLADPSAATPNGAAYIVISHGADGRGAYSERGTLQGATTLLLSCVPSASYASRVDSQNCIPRAAAAAGQGALTVTGAGGSTIPYRTYYDSRFNAGYNVTSYFDDYVIWRTKAGLL